MSDIRDDFLKALAADEDDETMRLIYADWLEEQGDDDEALRQRAWAASKAWLVGLCRESGEGDYEYLIELGHDGIGQGYANVGDQESLQDVLNRAGMEFWKHWSTVTGVKLPDDLEEHSIYFDCAC